MIFRGIAASVRLPGDAEEFDLLELVGRQCCVVIRHNKIEGQAELRANIVAVLCRR